MKRSHDAQTVVERKAAKRLKTEKCSRYLE